MNIQWHATFSFEEEEVSPMRDGLNSSLSLDVGIDGPKWVRKLDASIPRGEDGSCNFLRYGELEQLLEDLETLRDALANEASILFNNEKSGAGLGGLATDSQEAFRAVRRRRSEQWDSCQEGIEVVARALRMASSRC
jgi:hypothetical protein